MLELGFGISVAVQPREQAYVNTHSLLLDGTDDYFDTNNTFQTLLRNCETTGFTFSAWVNLDNVSGPQTLFGTQDTGGVANGLIGLYFQGTALYFIIRGRNDDTSAKSHLSGVFSAGASDEWNMWSVTFTPGASDTDVGTFTIYKNGVAQSSTVFGNTFTAQSLSNIELDANLHIGNWNGLDYDLDGHIDQWAFWNDDLSAANLLALYQHPGHDYTANSGNYQSAGKLDVYYKFDNNTDDATGTSNGSLGNDASFDTELPS
jgi:hypothetical protein